MQLEGVPGAKGGKGGFPRQYANERWVDGRCSTLDPVLSNTIVRKTTLKQLHLNLI